MSINHFLRHRCIALSLTLFSTMNVHAQATKPCIELKNDVQVEQEYTDAQGNKAKRLVAPGKIVPGNEVVYTITATNSCDKAASAVVINNPVPQHMNYVMNSAMGVGTDITYSVDGKSFAKLDALSVKSADGSSHAARAEDIKSLRWVYSTPINPGQSGFVRFRATVQ